MITEVAIPNEPDAISRAGIQKRDRNLANEELLIEIMAERGEVYTVKKGLSIENSFLLNIKVLFND